VSEVVASGTVTVEDSHGKTWDEIVEVFERDLTDTDGTSLTPEEVARRVAYEQASSLAGVPIGINSVDIS
jgi:hypothetical protein